MVELNQNQNTAFGMMGEDLFQIATKMLENETLTKLLFYTDNNPLEQPTLEDPYELLHRNIRIVPQLSEKNKQLGSYIVVTMNNFAPSVNYGFMQTNVTFEIITPIDKWLINSKSLRPYLIMQEILNMFDKQKLTGIGVINFIEGDIVILTPELVGYSLTFSSFNFR